MHKQTEACVRAVRARDPRFDGWFFVGVRTTGIYCRPSCPAMTPKAAHMSFHPSSAAAQSAGYRACKRCRPDAAPGSPQWDLRSDVVARAMRLIADGVLDRAGVSGLGAALGYSVRQVQRLVRDELGAGPLALARAGRAQTARLLIETTTLPMGEVAAAAGFASLRAFNTCVAEVFATSPTELRRAAAGRRITASTGTIDVRLPFRAPLCPDNLFGHLAATAVPGVEEWRAGAYRRTLRLPHGVGVVALTPPPAPDPVVSSAVQRPGPSAAGSARRVVVASAVQRPGPAPGYVRARLWLTDLRDLGPAIARCRRLLDLDADPVAIDELLGSDPALAPLVAAAPGRRVPRTVDGAEFAIRAVLGQQVSTAAARTHAGRLVARFGEVVDDPDGGLTHLFPDPAALDEAPQSLAMPTRRQATLGALLRALTEGLDLGPGADPAQARARLADLPGIGPWTTEVIAMRSLGDPDAFPVTDLGVRQAATALHLPDTPAALTARSTAWSPWRSYAVQYLWATGTHPVNVLPAQEAV